MNGLKQILWGLFKKIVIADNCAVYANDIFSHSGDYTGSTLLIGAVFFAIQIFGDLAEATVAVAAPKAVPPAHTTAPRKACI